MSNHIPPTTPRRVNNQNRYTRNIPDARSTTFNTDRSATSLQTSGASSQNETSMGSVTPAAPALGSTKSQFQQAKEIISNIGNGLTQLNEMATWSVDGIPDLGGTPNPLSAGDLETYQLTFYMFGNQVGQRYEESDFSFQEGNKLVFAKSGVTDIGFKSLEIEQVTGISDTEYTATNMKVRFTLVEAAGVTLMDRIATAVVGNGIDNFQKAMYGIDVGFKKRDPESGEPTDAADKKSIKIIILKMETDITHAGAVYNFEAVGANDLASSDTEGGLDYQISLSNTRASQVLSDIATKLTEQAKKDQGQAHASADLADQYEIILDPEILADDNIMPDSPVIDTTGERANLTLGDIGKFEISINNDTSINRAIDMVMSSTKWVKKNVKPNNEPDENEKKEYEVRRFYKIRTTVEILGYDKGKNDYVRKYIYTVKPFEMAESISQPEDKTIVPSALGFLGKLRDKVNKVYKYIYTGENTEVIKVDVKFNFAWFTPIPNFYGQQVSDMHIVGAAGVKDDQQDKLNNAHAKNQTKSDASPSPSSSNGEQVISAPAENTTAVYKRTLMPMTIAHDANGAVPRDRLAARSFVAALYNSAAIPSDQAQSPDMMTIDMTIRGDPDWMGGAASNPSGQPYFQFIMYLPIHDENDGGRVVPSAMLSGLYRVQKITNRFEGGKFSQDIFGIRDTTMITN